ncbi:helix-turn-helix transcriptional regulator [Nocardia sp. CDC153]|uniref:helix-turn-helix domain-containing protein n=1 Tax=Nocardia sp. CDC153 TaxID=3112167 RepID=UPI002DBF2FB4|nr:helix-turn-helix transcriptional regulator [Nocardia sp. CDC153]MEC3952349.1 helix-turn-helix transcriptional regulator [Nocardia sp. CDC153]
MTSGSTMARRALGRELKRLREAKRIRQSEGGRIIGVSPQTIGRMEDGLPTKVSDLYINTLCDAYDATAEERRILLELAFEVRATHKAGGGWWRAYADQIREGFDHYMGLEDSARSLSAWRLTLIPGLLQTPEYRRAIAWTETPSAPTEEIEKRLEVLVRRQTRLNDPTFAVDVLLSEMTLRDQIGGVGVMAGQLLKLLEVSELPNVQVRVVPFGTGYLGSRTGSFVLLEFPKLPASGLLEPPVVYVEEYAGDLYLEREAEVKRYREAFAEISRVALDHDTSRQFILSVAKEYGA